MGGITKAEYDEQQNIVYKQTQETVKQANKDVNIRLATVTCPCGSERSLVLMYRCLYCQVYFCKPCAEEHFGKTVDQYRKENPITN